MGFATTLSGWLRGATLGALAVAALGGHALGASEPSRIALVIVNSAYVDDPVDAGPDQQIVSAALNGIGFAVTVIGDGTASAMDKSVKQFLDRAKDADVALFYYAGHAYAGDEDDAGNWLLPIDAELEASATGQGIDLDKLGNDLAREAQRAVVVVDPLVDPDGRTLLEPHGADNVTYLYGSAPETQPYGEDSDSAFARAFATHIVEAGETFQTWLEEIQADVAEDTDNRQVPYYLSAMLDDVLVDRTAACANYFEEPLSADDLLWADVSAAIDACATAVAALPDDAYAKDLLAQAQQRQIAKDALTSEDAAALTSYLSHYPTGEFVVAARQALDGLGIDVAAIETASTPPVPSPPPSDASSSAPPDGFGETGTDPAPLPTPAPEPVPADIPPDDGVSPVEPSPPQAIPTPSPPPPPQPEGIVITSPDLSRGPMPVTGGVVDIAGTMQWNETILTILVDSQKATLGPNGSFSAHVTVPAGANSVTVVAVSTTGNTLTKTLDIAPTAVMNAQAAAPGKRYAVIIANQDYAATSGFVALKTPLNDATELNTVLSAQYGFTTEIADAAGKPTSLFLKNATARDIGLALYNLSKVVTDADTVAIYYAGHGVLDANKAYWVPSDASAGVWPSYISAASISDAIEHIKARKVIVISDSCFSGALMRGGPEKEAAIAPGDRSKALERIGADKSRILISSGNVEPVSDSGGNGHSIFAQALLNGLARMPENAFTAHELFDYIVTAVTANAKQEPQFRPLDDVGHEGGDVIFERISG